MAVRKLSDFKAALVGGGARPNLFEVELTNMPGVPSFNNKDTQDTFEFLCKGASLPAQNIASIDVPFRGRQFKVAGDRTIDNWTITIINDENFLIRNAFEQWTQQIANLQDNMGATNPASYQTNAKVFQLGRGSQAASTNAGGEDRATLKAYQFEGIWPVTVGDIALSYDTGDTIEEFDVEFAVQSIRLIAPQRESPAVSDTTGVTEGVSG